MRISENWPQVLASEAHSYALLQVAGKYRGNNAIGPDSIQYRLLAPESGAELRPGETAKSLP